MNMYVYFNRQLIVVETNMEFAIPYWEKRKRLHDSKHITWKFK